MWNYKEKSITQQLPLQRFMKKINAPFKNIFGVSFAKAQTNVPELDVQEKKSHAELKKERRKTSRDEKSYIQEKWSEKDCDTMLSTRQTYSQRQEQRLSLFFESSLGRHCSTITAVISATTTANIRRYMSVSTFTLTMHNIILFLGFYSLCKRL